jgi:undecaprenyl pyrophosphate synthase
VASFPQAGLTWTPVELLGAQLLSTVPLSVMFGCAMAKNKIPRHVGFIPDGNHRWAMDHGLLKKADYL